MENNSEEVKASDSSQTIDNRIAAVRDLIFGENIQQYNSEFADVYKRIDELEQLSNQKLSESVSTLENKLAELESLMERKILDLTNDFEKRLADLNDKKADRRKLGKALEKIALMLQE